MKPTNKKKTQVALAVGTVLSGMAFSPAAIAACTVDGETYTVNNAFDAISMTPDQVTLRQAILDANADPATCDLINFAESMNGQTINLDLIGNGDELDINGNVNIVGPGSDQLTIKTSGAGSHERAMNFEAGDISVSGITFDGEGTSSSAGLYGYPFSAANIELDDIVVKNVADQQGLYLYGGSGGGDDVTLVVTNSRFEGNARAGIGVQQLAQVSVSDSEFVSNVEEGLYIGQTPMVTIEGIESDGNMAGGLYVSARESISITDSVVTNNQGEDGAGIYIPSSADPGRTVTIENVIVDGNTADFSGGGIYIGGSAGTATIRNSTISNNEVTSGNGGGVDTSFSNGDFQLIIEQSTISGNSATRGGGVAYTLDAGTLTESQIIRFSTITENTASNDGGGIYANTGASDIRISNSIVAGNTATTSDNDLQVIDSINVSMNTVDASYSYFGTSEAADITDNNSVLNGGDPMLAGLGMPTLGNGETEVHEPEMGSPVIDIGDPALMAGIGDTPTLDQIGRTRVANSRIDLGSVEYNANVAPVLDEPIAEGTVEVGTEFELDLDDFFSDANGDVITYSILNSSDLPDSIDLTGSIVSGTFVEGDIGTYTVEYQACDDEPLCTTGSGSLVIEEMTEEPEEPEEPEDPEEEEEESSGGGSGAFGAGLLMMLIGLLPAWMRRRS